MPDTQTAPLGVKILLRRIAVVWFTAISPEYDDRLDLAATGRAWRKYLHAVIGFWRSVVLVLQNLPGLKRAHS